VLSVLFLFSKCELYTPYTLSYYLYREFRNYCTVCCPFTSSTCFDILLSLLSCCISFAVFPGIVIGVEPSTFVLNCIVIPLHFLAVGQGCIDAWMYIYNVGFPATLF